MNQKDGGEEGREKSYLGHEFLHNNFSFGG